MCDIFCGNPNEDNCQIKLYMDFIIIFSSHHEVFSLYLQNVYYPSVNFKLCVTQNLLSFLAAIQLKFND